MAGIRIDWNTLELAFENHAPDVRSYLDVKSGEVVSVTERDPKDDDLALEIQAHPENYVLVEPVASRDQYRMMERFIETVTHESLRQKLADSIVGKGAFRRFKDVIGRSPEERKRWFAFRDVLLHQHILSWLKTHRVELLEMPDWTLDLPEASSPEEVPGPVEPIAAPPPGAEPKDAEELTEYLQAWARAHGEEYRFLFGPAAFERLAQDISQEFTFYRRH